MKKPTKHLFTQAMLASTLLIGTAHATQFGTGATPSTPPPTVGPISVAAQADNIVEVLGGTAAVAGQIVGTDANGVNLDKAAGAVIVDAQNGFAGINAISVVKGGAAAAGIGVDVTAANGSIFVGPGSGINSTNAVATSDAISVGADATSISNFGTISSSDFSAIHLLAAGTNTVLTNNLGGVIQNTPTGTTPVILVDTGGAGFTLNNAGFINQLTAAEDIIQLNGNFTSINNLSGGLIQGMGAGSDINVAKAITGNITNQAGGTISVISGAGHGITVNAALTGTITNAGDIKVDSGSTLNLLANVSGAIVNSGNLVSIASADGTIFSKGAVLTGGLFNTGNIVDQTPGSGGVESKAIDLAASSATFTQAGGIVTGNVYLATLDSGNVAGKQQTPFIMTGGTINGNVTAETNGVAGTTNLLTLNGGSIFGQISLGNNGDTINLQGTQVNGAMVGGGGADTLNILSSFTNNSIIDSIESINVNAGLFTQNNAISGLTTALTVAPGAQMLLNANISGAGGTITNNGTIFVTGTPMVDFTPQAGASFTNNGVLSLGNTATFTLNDTNILGTFTNNVGGTLLANVAGIMTANGSPTSGQLVVNATAGGGPDFVAGSFILPQVNGFTPQGSTYNIVSVVGGGAITDNSTLLPASSVVIAFSKALNAPTNDILQLVANRTSFTALSSTQVTQGVAAALDVLATEKGFISVALLGQMDPLTSQDAVENAMESLVPPFNYGLVAASFAGMDTVFDSVQTRLRDLTAMRRGLGVAPRTRVASQSPAFSLASNQASTGVNLGDPAGAGSVWITGLGAYLNQKERDEVAGYKAKAEGIAIGGDWGASDCVTLGVAGSFTKANVDDKNVNPKDQGIKSWQATAYGWFEFREGVYLDTILGIASNHYKTNRVINVNNIHTAAQGDFHGTQFGVQGDLGWLAWTEGNCYFAPFARVQYMHLDLDDYTESGADFLNLNVNNQDLNTLLGGIGFKTGTSFTMRDVIYTPELTALIGYDFENDSQQTVAGFVGGGPAFGTDGIKPGRTLFELGLGLDARVSKCSVLGVKYKLDLRDDFTSNAGYIQYSYLWG